jgi:MFS family permease
LNIRSGRGKEEGSASRIGGRRRMNEFSLRSKSFIGVCLFGFFYFGSHYLLFPTLPQYVASLGGTTSQIGVVIAVFTLISVVVRPSLARAADAFGRKKLMILGAAVSTLMFVFYSRVDSISSLYVLRAVHGIAHGSCLGVSFAYVADLAPMNRRGEVMGIFGVANVFGMAVFPAIGSAIITNTQSFPTLFTVSIIIAAVAFLCPFFLEENKPGIRKGEKVSFRAVIRQRPVLVASLALFTTSTVFGAVSTFVPVFAPQRGVANVGLFFTSYAIVTLGSRLFAGRLSDRLGRRKVILPFMALVALAVFLLPLLHSVYLLVLIGACYGLGAGAVQPALGAYVVDETTREDRATALSFFTAFMDIGITAGALVLGIAGQFWGYETMFLLAGVTVILGLMLFTGYSKPGPAQQTLEGLDETP